MKKRILNVLTSSLGDGFIKIIYGPKGSGKTTFLLKDVRDLIVKNSRYYYINFKTLTYKDAYDKITKLSRENRRYVLLIDDIFSYANPESMINLIFSCKNVEAIATSDVSVSYALKSKATQVRGRIYTIFYPNYLYEEYNSENKDTNLFSYYRYLLSKNETVNLPNDELFTYICHNFGNLLTFNNIFRQKDVNNSIVTVIRKFNNYLGQNWFYVLPRIDLMTMHNISTGFVVFPTNYNLIPNKEFHSERNLNIYATTSIVEKLFYDNWKVYIGTYRYQKNIENRRIYFIKNICLIAKKRNRSVLIGINIGSSANYQTLFNNLKIPLQKIIIELGNGRRKYDYNGVMRIGIEKFLCEGVDSDYEI